MQGNRVGLRVTIGEKSESLLILSDSQEGSRKWRAGMRGRTRHSIRSLISWSISTLSRIRGNNHKVLYPLDEVLLLSLLGVLAGCESWVEIAKFGEKKLELLRRFRPFRVGTPSHDQLGDIFAALDAEQFQHGFIA